MKPYWTEEKGFDRLQFIENLKEKAKELRSEAARLEKAAELLGEPKKQSEATSSGT